MNDKHSQRALHLLKLHHARLRATRPELLPAWQAVYLDRVGLQQYFSKPDPLHPAYALLLDSTYKDEPADYAAALQSC